MDKYYTPEISEFFVGFEYETSYLQDYDTWKKEILEEDDAGYFQSIYFGDAVPTEFRVKYLSREDIESLGFSQIDYDTYRFGIEEIYLEFNPEYKTFIYSKKYDPIKNNNLFVGTIKNKSELIKLLKQLQMG